MDSQQSRSHMTYDVIINPKALEITVTMTVPADCIDQGLTLAIPTWVPGDYAFESYGRDIFEVSARDLASGASLAVNRKGFNEYHIPDATGDVSVNYRASCYEPDLGDALGLVDSDYTLLMGTRYLFCPNHQGTCQVNYLNLPAGWRFHHPSGAEQIGDSPSWIYPSFEILLDTPVVFGNFTLKRTSVQNTPFYYVFVDQGVGFDATVDRFITQVGCAVEKIYDVFGEFPFDDYTFFLSLNPQADWGLEHLTSNMSGLGPEVFVDEDQYSSGIRVCVHELFHAWNVRRLRPAPLGQLSHKLSCGCFTEGLWMAEGFTRYYEFLISTRAKAYTPQQFFSAVANYYQHLSQQPAYMRVSASDSSLATYMNHQKYPGRVNNGIDYYDKGMLIAFEVDSQLRLTSDDTLDKAFSGFYQACFGPGKHVPADYVGYSTSDVVNYFNQRHTGLGNQIAQLVDQPASLNTIQQFVNLGFSPVFDAGFNLGLFFLNASEPTIYGIADTGAGGGVGLAPNDVIVSVNGYAYSEKSLKWAANHSAPVTLEVLRGHRQLTFTLQPKPIERLKQLQWVGNTEQAQRIASWLDDENFNPADGQIFEIDFYQNFHGIETLI